MIQLNNRKKYSFHFFVLSCTAVFVCYLFLIWWYWYGLTHQKQLLIIQKTILKQVSLSQKILWFKSCVWCDFNLYYLSWVTTVTTVLCTYTIILFFNVSIFSLQQFMLKYLKNYFSFLEELTKQNNSLRWLLGFEKYICSALCFFRIDFSVSTIITSVVFIVTV